MTPTQSAEKKLKIMFIDDSLTIHRAAHLFLGEYGYDIVCAQDGLDALGKMGLVPPDIIFCDILMPKLDGYETCALIKKNPTFKKVPFVMLSSQSSIFDKAKAFLVGADDHIPKPFDRDSLKQVIDRFCGKALHASAEQTSDMF